MGRGRSLRCIVCVYEPVDTSQLLRIKREGRWELCWEPVGGDARNEVLHALTLLLPISTLPCVANPHPVRSCCDL